MADKPFVHTVHTTFHMHTTHEDIRITAGLFKDLSDSFAGDDAVIFIGVGLNTRRSRRRGSRSFKRVHMVQVVAFKNQESFDRFREHPLHLQIKDKLRLIADWDSGDLDLASTQFASLQAFPAQ